MIFLKQSQWYRSLNQQSQDLISNTSQPSKELNCLDITRHFPQRQRHHQHMWQANSISQSPKRHSSIHAQQGHLQELQGSKLHKRRHQQLGHLIKSSYTLTVNTQTQLQQQYLSRTKKLPWLGLFWVQQSQDGIPRPSPHVTTLQLLEQIAVEYGNIRFVGSQPWTLYRPLVQLCNRKLVVNQAAVGKLSASVPPRIKHQALVETFGAELSHDLKMALSAL